MAIKKCQPKALTPYLDGELTPETREQVEEHLRSCAACGALLDEVTSARERVHGMGRSLIPATTLMPALEFFRERAGIGDARRLDPVDIPALSVDTPPVAEDPAFDQAVPMDGPEIYDDPRFHAVLAGAPLDGVGLMDPPPAVETEVTTVADAPAVEDPAAEDLPTVTWVTMDTPVDVAADDTLVSHRPHVPEPPRLDPAPWMTSATVVEDPAALAEEVAPAPAPVLEPPPIPEPPPRPKRLVHEERPREPGAFSAIVRPTTPDPQVEELAVAEDAGALPWEQEAPAEIPTAALEDRPDAPEPQPVPPWVEAEVADAEDIEARGRRLVEEDLAAQVAMEREAGGAWRTAAPGPKADDEVAAAVAGMREELTGPPASGTAATFPAVESSEDLEGYPGALRTQRRDARTTALPALDRQVKIGLAVAAAVVVIAVAGVLVVPRLLGHRAVTAATTPAATPAVKATPAATASPSVGAAGSPAPSTAPGVPQLTGVVPAGAGGSGYRVLGIRTGNPAAGVYRIVFDLEGSGAAPDAKLGRAADGSLYLQATGINIDPAAIATFKPIGPISGLSTTEASGGLSLKLASSLAQSPQYSLYYLTDHPRLVIDLK